MTQDPTPYDLLQDAEISGLQELVTPYYSPPGGQEHSFPVVGQGVSAEQFQLIGRAAGTGVYIQHDQEGAVAPYRLVGMPGGNSETNATNNMRLLTSNRGNRSEAAMSGFFHAQTEDMTINFPPVTTPTTYHLCLTYDPREEENPDGPIRIQTYAGEPPTTHNRKHIILYTVEREPNQLLSDARVTRTLPWLGHVINVFWKDELPEATATEYGTLAVVINPGEGRPELYTNRGVWGWQPVKQTGEWRDLAQFGGWSYDNAVSRIRDGGVDVTGVFVRTDQGTSGNRSRLGRLAEAHRPARIFRAPIITSRYTGNRGISIDPSTGDINVYGGDIEGGWVEVNVHIPDIYFED